MNEYQCDTCGKTVRYTSKIDQSYYQNNERIGYRDEPADENLCLECEGLRFAEEGE